MTYRTRKEQIEKDFLKRLARDLRAAGCTLNRAGYSLIKNELRAAAMVGAAEERERIIKILPVGPWDGKIFEKSVLQVLGYE